LLLGPARHAVVRRQPPIAIDPDSADDPRGLSALIFPAGFAAGDAGYWWHGVGRARGMELPDAPPSIDDHARHHPRRESGGVRRGGNLPRPRRAADADQDADQDAGADMDDRAADRDRDAVSGDRDQRRATDAHGDRAARHRNGNASWGDPDCGDCRGGGRAR